MGFAKFEEKEFEKPLYNQLEDGPCDIWTPGQCLEACIGFDFSGNITNDRFWKRFDGFIPKGVILNDYNMNYFLRKMKKKRMLPNFSLNLFIQAKRPYVHSGKNKDSVYCGQHYSFEINHIQQDLLDALDRKLRHRALLVYASPIFGTYEELYQYTKDKKIIDKTSFPRINTLSGHSHWYYCDNCNGIAYSEPEKHKINNIFGTIESFIYKNTQIHMNTSYAENLESLYNSIIETVNDYHYNAQVNYFFSKIEKVDIDYEYDIGRLYRLSYSLWKHYHTISTFCDVFNLDWFVLNPN